MLTVSPVLLEKYLSAAAAISRQAIGDASLAPTSTEFPVPPATVQSERESRDLPIGSRGGIAVRHHFPLDAEYVIKVRLQRGKDATTIVGMSEPRRLDVRLDGRRVKQFIVGGPGPVNDDGLEVRLTVPAGSHLASLPNKIDLVHARVDEVKEEANQLKTSLNKPSPDWSATDIDGKPVKLADLRGKVVIMDFWYRGCVFCMFAMPQVKQLAEDYRDKPVVMFSETSAGSPPAVKAWFYPGETDGYEFVYPRDQAMKIAQVTHQPVLTTAVRSPMFQV